MDRGIVVIVSNELLRLSLPIKTGPVSGRDRMKRLELMTPGVGSVGEDHMRK